MQSKGLSRVFSNTTVQKHQVFGDLTKKVRYLANQIFYIEKQAKEIVDMGLKVMFEEGETYNPIQQDYYNKAKDFLKN